MTEFSTPLSPDLRVSEETYLEMEKHAEERHEFFDGTIVAMAGAGDWHELVAGGIFVQIFNFLRGKGCRTYKGDMKLRVEHKGRVVYYYPDVMVTCDPNDDEDLFKKVPKLIVEVVSADWKHDYIEKLAAYTLLPSLEEYLILRPRPKQKGATVFRRHDGWEPHEIEAGGSIELRSIGLMLPLDDLYVP